MCTQVHLETETPSLVKSAVCTQQSGHQAEEAGTVSIKMLSVDSGEMVKVASSCGTGGDLGKPAEGCQGHTDPTQQWQCLEEGLCPFAIADTPEPNPQFGRRKWIWGHGIGPQPADSKKEVTQQRGLAGDSCSPHGGQEAERRRSRPRSHPGSASNTGCCKLFRQFPRERTGQGSGGQRRPGRVTQHGPC